MLFQFGDLTEFAGWAGGATAAKATVSGLGDAAFIGPQVGDEPNVLAFRKGTRGVRLTATKVDEQGKLVVPMEQLRMMADLVASRLE